MRTSWKIGDRIEGRWEVHHVIKGGMGIVYIVYDHEHRTPYAVKTLRDDDLADDDAIAEFVQEALTWINLDVHENVTRAEFIETISGKPFLFLEYVSGGNLGRWIDTPRLTEDLPQVLRFAIQLCDAMNHAAAKGIKVHRDIKPQNCLVTDEQTLKVTDFGLAKSFREISPGRRDNDRSVKKRPTLELNDTETGMGAGTCTYMAPEQFDDLRPLDVRADIYAFGVLLFEMITGNLPFDGDSWDDLKRLHQTQPPPPLPNSVPPLLSQLVNSCLRKNPSERYANFIELRQKLAAIYKEVTGTEAPQPIRGAELDSVQWSNKGTSLSKLGRYTEALDCYEHALRLNPELKEAWNNKGLALSSLGKYSDGVICYEHALTSDSSFGAAWNNRGSALEVLGRVTEALDCYDRALALNPQLKESWKNKGRALGALDRHLEALACYQHAVAIDQTDAEAWSRKGDLLQALGRHTEALVCYEHVLEVDNGNAEVWSRKGSSLQALGRHAEALGCYQHALTLDPNVVSGKLTRWAARALLSCHRLFKLTKRVDEPECSVS